MKLPSLFLIATVNETGTADDKFSKKLLSPYMVMEAGMVSSAVFVVSVFDLLVSVCCEQVSQCWTTRLFLLVHRISSTIQMNMVRNFFIGFWSIPDKANYQRCFYLIENWVRAGRFCKNRKIEIITDLKSDIFAINAKSICHSICFNDLRKTNVKFFLEIFCRRKRCKPNVACSCSKKDFGSLSQFYHIV